MLSRFSRVQLFATLCSPPGCSVHGILQARILESVAMPSSRESSQPGDRTRLSLGLLHCRQILYTLSQLGSPAKSLRGFTRHGGYSAGQRLVTLCLDVKKKHKGNILPSSRGCNNAHPTHLMGKVDWMTLQIPKLAGGLCLSTHIP